MLKIHWQLGMSVTLPCRDELQKLESILQECLSVVSYDHEHLSLNTEPQTHTGAGGKHQCIFKCHLKCTQNKALHCLVTCSTWWPSTAQDKCSWSYETTERHSCKMDSSFCNSSLHGKVTLIPSCQCIFSILEPYIVRLPKL